MKTRKPKQIKRGATGESSSTVRVGLTQMSCGDDARENLEKQVRLLDQAANDGAKILCTQELFRSKYFCQVEDHRFFKVAETIPGPSTDAFVKVAKKHGAVVIGSLFEKRADGLYHNTAVVIDADGSIKGVYRKMHITDDPLYYEKFYFTPGDTGFRAWNTAHGKIGVLICWDQWFPEGARLTALQGAQILFYPTAIGWHPAEKKLYGAAQHESWELIQRSHAVANGCCVCATNRVGAEENLDFWGGSFVADPFGKIVAKAPHDHEEIVLAQCDMEKIDVTRRHWPFLRDRRVDAYADLMRRYRD